MNLQKGVKNSKAHVLGLPSWYPSGEGDHNGVFCLAQLEALAAAGHQVGIVAAVTQQNPAHRQGIDVHRYSWGVACVARYRSGSNQMLQAIRYARAMHQAWVQYVLLFGRPQYALVLVAWKAGLFARWLKYRHRIPYNIIEHWGLYISDNYVNTSIYLRILFKYIFSGAERTGAVSEPLARALFDNKITQKVPVVVPNVVHTDLYRIPPETEIIPKSAVHEQDHVDPAPSDSRPLLMHVSNLAEVKNFSFVLDVFAAYRTRFPDARLWVAGAFNPMDAKARYDSNSANVEWFGFADQHTLLRHYQRATALIVASRHETFSIVTAEAIACGCPVLSTPLPALEAFKDWGTLCSLPAQHPDAWADVLEAWTKSRPKTKDHAWDGLHQAYGKKSVGNFISRWITDY